MIPENIDYDELVAYSEVALAGFFLALVGRKINAIKEMRSFFGGGLKEWKVKLETWVANPYSFLYDVRMDGLEGTYLVRMVETMMRVKEHNDVVYRQFIAAEVGLDRVEQNVQNALNRINSIT